MTLKVVDVRLRLLMPQSTYTPRDLDDLLDVLRLHAYETAEVADVIVSPVGLVSQCWGCSDGAVLVGCPVHDPGRGNTQNPSKDPRP